MLLTVLAIPDYINMKYTKSSKEYNEDILILYQSSFLYQALSIINHQDYLSIVTSFKIYMNRLKFSTISYFLKDNLKFIMLFHIFL